MAAAAVAVTLACTLAPVTAAHAETRLPHREDASPPELSLGGLIEDLMKALDEAGAFEDAEGLEGVQSASTTGSVSRISLSEGFSAQVAKPAGSGQGISGLSICSWVLKTRLAATYDPSTHDLQQVTGTPEATLNCGGTFGLPVRQDGTLQHALNGAAATTVGGQRCGDDAGCPRTNVTGTYDCSGAACAGTHRLTLRHTWTLPSPYVWTRPPSHCEVADRGATLRCVSRGKTVTIPEARGGISISDAPLSLRIPAA